ncbi:MAG: helix-turn-helix domain-containing protein [Pseudomonadota bacterium]
MSEFSSDPDNDAAPSAARTLFDSLIRRAGKMAGGTLEIALDMAATSAMNGDSWVRELLKAGASTERLQAMVDAGNFLRDARETAGLSLAEVSERLGLGDDSMLEGVERGEALLPIDVIFRAASLLARHDPIPFLIKFFRSYNPQLESTLEQWGVMSIPKNYERERRFLNVYRQHDFLRDLDDEAHQRFIEYMDASTRLVVEVMEREAGASPLSTGKRKPTASKASTTRARSRKKQQTAGTKSGGETPKPKARKASSRAPQSGKGNPASMSSSQRASTGTDTTAKTRPVVRKVKPRSA